MPLRRGELISDRKLLEDMLRAVGGKATDIAGEPTIGVYEIADESAGMSSLIGMETVVVPTEAVGDTPEGATVTVDGEGSFLMQYSVRERDGALSRLALTPNGGGG